MNDIDDSCIQACLTYSLANADVRQWPFPHVYIENVFPDDFYAGLMNTMPTQSDYVPISAVRGFNKTTNNQAYPNRFVIAMNEHTADLGPYWNSANRVIRANETSATLINMFGDALHDQMMEKPALEADVLLIRDRTNYKLGPHTDNQVRVLVFILYLPETTDDEDLGTNIYVPKVEGVTCPGGPHYIEDVFQPVFRAPYRPNSALAFVKTDNSFHGVTPVPEGKERNIIHYFLRRIDG